MQKTAIKDHFFLYQFPPRPDHPKEEWGVNLYVFIDGKEALLIDTGFEEHAQAVKEDLAQSGIEIRQVILSHSHPDHISGLKALSGVAIWASGRLQESTVPFGGPVQKLDESSHLSMGSFDFTFYPAPGHSPCSLNIVINERMIHAADNIMSLNDGTPMLPWAEFKDVGEHIQSLLLLKDLAPEVLLPGHGVIITGKEAICEEIDLRLSYLQAVWDGKGEIGIEEATANCSRRFSCESWHIQR